MAIPLDGFEVISMLAPVVNVEAESREYSKFLHTFLINVFKNSVRSSFCLITELRKEEITQYRDQQADD